jgi:hypothetical protein
LFGSLKNFILKYKVNAFFSLTWTLIVYIQAFGGLLPKTQGVTGLPFGASAEQIRKAWGNGDAGSLLDAALTWSQLKDLDPTTQYWIVHLWTPGMPLLEVPLIWLSHFTFPFFFWILFLTITIWLIAWNKLLNFTKYNKFLLYFSIVSILLWTLSWDSQYIFRDGIFYTEGISLGLICLAFTFTLSEKNYLIAGFTLGLSLLVRHVNDTGLSIIYEKMKRVTKKNQHIKNKNLDIMKKSKLIPLFRLILGTLLATGLWRFYLSPKHYQGWFYTLSTAGAGTPAGIWAKEGGYWADYDVNWACKFDTTGCNEIWEIGINNWSGSSLILKALVSVLKNPFGYLEHRLPYLWRHWAGDTYPGFWTIQRLTTYLLLILVILSIVIVVVNIVNFKSVDISTLFLSGLMFGQLINLAIIHFESRYFITIRLLSLLIMIDYFRGLHFLNLKQIARQVEIDRKRSK